MGDAIDETFDEEGDDEEEGQALVHQVLDELGVQMSGKLADVPSAQPAAATAAGGVGVVMVEGAGGGQAGAGPPPAPPGAQGPGDEGGGAASDLDRQLQERLDKLRKS